MKKILIRDCAKPKTAKSICSLLHKYKFYVKNLVKKLCYIKTVLKLMTQNKSGLNSQHILKMESRYYAIGTAAFLLLKLNSSGIDLFCPQDEGRSRLMIVISDKELSAPRLPMSRCLPSAHVI